MVTTTNKGLAEPASGDLNWNVPLNSNFEIIAVSYTHLTLPTNREV